MSWSRDHCSFCATSRISFSFAHRYEVLCPGFLFFMHRASSGWTWRVCVWGWTTPQKYRQLAKNGLVMAGRLRWRRTEQQEDDIRARLRHTEPTAGPVTTPEQNQSDFGSFMYMQTVLRVDGRESEKKVPAPHWTTFSPCRRRLAKNVFTPFLAFILGMFSHISHVH